MTFKDLIKSKRLEKGWTLEMAANLIGTSKSQIWELENGATTNPTATTLAGLCREYKISPRKMLSMFGA
jgi:transcriptional regulator with XRE-family HTH domain